MARGALEAGCRTWSRLVLADGALHTRPSAAALLNELASRAGCALSAVGGVARGTLEAGHRGTSRLVLADGALSTLHVMVRYLLSEHKFKVVAVTDELIAYQRSLK